MKTLVALGTRPEAVKLAPLALALRDAGIAAEVLFSRQHEALAQSVFDIFRLVPEHVFTQPPSSFSLHDLAASYLQQAGAVIARVRPDLVIVQGDTTTAYTAALAAYYLRVPVAHVEAGLRTGNAFSPYPEENHRRMIAVLADLHFAPSPYAVEELRAENIASERIFMTGNTVIDALRWILDNVPDPFKDGKNLPSGDARPYILVTAHRRENFDTMHQAYFQRLNALAAALPALQVIFVTHPNPNVQRHAVRELKEANIFQIPPLAYDEFIHLMRGARLIITDSGGVQEESAYLGKPVLLMRENTERKELQDGCNLIVVGLDSGRLMTEAQRLLTDAAYYQTFSRVHTPYGVGDSAQRIVGHIQQWWHSQKSS